MYYSGVLYLHIQIIVFPSFYINFLKIAFQEVLDH